jgi:hypothetical protein
MKSKFEHKLVLKINKDSQVCNLSIQTSEDKVEVFKISKRDLSHLVAQYLEYDSNMEEADDLIVIKTEK